ncbi:hypothetical protein ACFQ2B_37585 [Streptomyces stramineus]
MAQHHHVTRADGRPVLDDQLVARVQRGHHRRVVDLGQSDPQQSAAFAVLLLPALVHSLLHHGSSRSISPPVPD